MGIKEVELRISNYLILYEGKGLTRKQTIAKIIHIQQQQIVDAKKKVAEEIFGEIEARWNLHNDGLNPPWIKLDYSEYQALKERYQGEKK